MKKTTKPKSDETLNAFNIRLPESLTAKLDQIAEGGPAPLSRTQLIQRVLVEFVQQYEWETDDLENNVPTVSPRAHIIAGHFGGIESWRDDPKKGK